ncbi:CYFA0S01e06194g1_1 [Cyberlindnera fabianii]|uniref:CYFA0S01e06194g1_1 n=1 Tax=Cyberlindnera fabianii TaxID=36022 RepID=A0A061AHF4_CYBFA|nr:CYFA0S01e06194g1_1 [Cyberlindnera fabianii]
MSDEENAPVVEETEIVEAGSPKVDDTADAVENTEVTEQQTEEVDEDAPEDDDNDDDDKNVNEQEEDGDYSEHHDEDGDHEILDYDDVAKLKPSKRSGASQATPPARKSKSAEPEQIEGDDNEQVVPENFDESTKRRQELEAKLERALKRPKIKRRKDEHDLTNDDDELIQILKQQMDTAAKQDAELIESETGVAMNKIQLLPKVRNILSKANLAEVILDNNLLAEVRQWLEPLPNASLPSYEIQKTLFAALLKLPINTNHLRESGIGKILLFYQKSKRVEPDIKRVADKLVSDWTRPIIGASDNYRDKRFSSVEFDAAKLKEKMNRPKKRLTEEEKKRREAEKSIYEQQAARRNRAAAPAPTVTDYKFAPKSRVDKNAMSITQAGVGSSLNRDDQFKRIKAKLSGRRAGGSKKGGISIEGRGTQGF